MINSLVEEHRPKKQAKRFKYAFEGIWHALLNEANFRVQLVFALLVTIAGFYFKLTGVEWSVLILGMGMLLTAEMANTTIEAIMDHMTPEYDERVKIIKDLSAGFVLIMAVAVFIITILIFSPYIASIL